MKDIKYSLPLEALEEKQTSSTSIFDGKVLHVRLDGITLPNGKEATREYCHHNGAVCVIPLTDEQEVILSPVVISIYPPRSGTALKSLSIASTIYFAPRSVLVQREWHSAQPLGPHISL